MTGRLRNGEAGSVLMLVPAGVLVLLVLAAVCVDSAIVLLAERELAARTAAAANDVAAAAVDDATFYAGGGAVALDDRLADEYVRLAFADDRRPGGFRSWTADAAADGRTVTVVARAEVDHLFAHAIPGVARSTTVEARSVVSVQGG